MFTRFVAVLALVTLIVWGFVLIVHDGAKNGYFKVRVVERRLLAVPVMIADLPDFLDRTSWKLVAENVVTNLKSSSREDLDIVVCSGRLKSDGNNFKFFNSYGVISPPGSNMVVLAIFPLDPKCGP